MGMFRKQGTPQLRFSSDNIVASSQRKLSQSKISSSSASSSNSNDNDQWVTKMLRERAKAESSYLLESNVSARSLTRKRFLETNKSPLSPSTSLPDSSSQRKPGVLLRNPQLKK